MQNIGITMKSFLISLLAVWFVGCGSSAEPTPENYLQLIQDGEIEQAKEMQCEQSILYIPPAVDEFEIVSERSFELQQGEYPMSTAKIILNGETQFAFLFELTPKDFLIEAKPVLTAISQDKKCLAVERDF